MTRSSIWRRGAARETRELTIGQLARLAELSPDALRFYERRGLMEPVRRTSAGYRLYDRIESHELPRRRAAGRRKEIE